MASAEFELYGRRWQVPDIAEDVLTRIYGDWRKPNPGYLHWRDCRAIVERYPWTGETETARLTPALTTSSRALVRIAMMGLIPSRWFLKPPDPATVTARSGILDIEIVSHCWQYAHLLAYQLSSLVNFPPTRRACA